MRIDHHKNTLTEPLIISYPKTAANPTAQPLPTQRKFHNSNSKYRLLAGGFATGKTTTLCIEVLYELLNFPNNYGVLGRKDLGELKSTTLKEFLDICPKQLIKNHNKSDHVIKMVNGSELYYMNLDDSREASEKIKSLNLGFVAIDQLEEIQENIFLAFVGRLRRYNTSRNFFATCNPAGHDWIWTKWKDKPPSTNYELFETITLENIYLPEDYIKELLAYPERWVKRYVYCSWEDFEGLVFNEYTETLNTVTSYEPKDVDYHVHVMDYGYRNPTCILFSATDYDGNTYVYDEIYKPMTRIPVIAEEYKLNKWVNKARKIADPSISKVERDGNNVKSEYAMNGVYWQEADNDVRQGIDRVNTMFKNQKLFITKNCVNLIREMGAYKWKQIKVGQERNEYEEPTKKDDHACDALRYLVNDIFVPIEYSKPIITERQEALMPIYEDSFTL